METNTVIDDPAATPDRTDSASADWGPPPPPPQPEPRRSWLDVPLARDRDNRKLGGVVAGISTAYGFDRRTTRIAVAIGALVVPALIALYIAGWIFFPRDRSNALSLRQIVTDRRRRPLMVVLAVAAVVTGFGSWSFFGGVGWGFAFVAAGVLLWLMPNLGSFDAPESAQPGAVGQPVTRRRKRPIQAIGLAAASLGAVVAGIGNSADWWNASTYGIVLSVLITLIAATVVGAVVNRSWFGIPMLMMLGVLSAGLLVTHPNLDGGMGDRTFRPTTIDAAGDDHQLGIGRLTLDLRDVPLGAQPVEIDATVGYGQIRLFVPEDTEVVVTSDINAGDIVVNGSVRSEGFRQDDMLTVPARGEGAHHTVVIDVSIGAGELKIVQDG